MSAAAIAVRGEPKPPSATLPAMSLAALGIVFGDIGTSPLYALKTVLDLAGGSADARTALGALSLIVWTLVIVTSIKYVGFAMRVDNDGEGGILALMALLGVKRRNRPMIVAMGLLGAALIYGDGAITPAISVLSAFEGLELAAPSVTPYVLPVSALVLVALFLLQPLGTAHIGRAFGPVMAFWFLVIGVLGLGGIARHPSVLLAVDPRYGISFLLHGGMASFLILGGVFLCVTGAEALYADMGHFGARPIRLAWSALVLPSLLLNYAGQTAILLEGAPPTDSMFYRLCPPALLVPLVVLAAAATVIASQSIITGAFSMTRQAIQLGCLPRLHVRQTSAIGFGQIYVGPVNWLLMVATLALAIGFGKSDNLAAAYGIAVSATMLLTSMLLFIAMREIWRWNLIAAGTVAGLFVIIDAAFFAANSAKFLDGGYVPIALAAVIYLMMSTWRQGRSILAERLRADSIETPIFLDAIRPDHPPRVPGTAVFMTGSAEVAPLALLHNMKHNKVLHERVVLLTVTGAQIPWIADEERVSVAVLPKKFYRVVVRYGFMESPDIPAALELCRAKGLEIDLADTSFFLGRETLIPAVHPPMAPWREKLFVSMSRNALSATDFFRIPTDRVVELGAQVQI